MDALTHENINALVSYSHVVDSNSVMTHAQYDRIITKFKTYLPAGHGAHTATNKQILEYVVWPFVLYLWNNGSSTRLNSIDFESPVAEEGVPVPADHAAIVAALRTFKFATIGEAVLSVCTFRQFAAFFANLVWNYQITHNRASALAEKKGFLPDTRMAAFDFFHGVGNPNAFKVPLLRVPTLAEKTAHQTAMSVYITRANRKTSQVSLATTEVTQGRIDAGGSTLPLPKPLQITEL